MAFAIGTVQTAQRLGPALGPVIGGDGRAARRPAQRVPRDGWLLRRRRWSSCSSMYQEPAIRSRGATPARRRPRRRFAACSAFENFIAADRRGLRLEFVDRSFGPVLPLYVAELGHVDRATCPSCPASCSRSRLAPARSGTICAGAFSRAHSTRAVIAAAAAVGGAWHPDRTWLPAERRPDARHARPWSRDWSGEHGRVHRGGRRHSRGVPRNRLRVAVDGIARRPCAEPGHLRVARDAELAGSVRRSTRSFSCCSRASSGG